MNLKQIIIEEVKRQLKEMSNDIKDYSNSKHKILVGTKTPLLHNMKQRYDFEVKGDETYFFDNGFHFATLYQAGRFSELLHDGSLDDLGYRRQLKEIDSKIDMNKTFAVISKGGSIGGNKANYDPRLKGTVIATFDTKEEADAYAQRRNKTLSPGEKKQYGMSYSSVKIK